MSILVIVKTKVKSDFTSEFKSYLSDILPDTRVFDGCNSIEMYSEVEDGTNIVFVENWASQEDYKKYHLWRTESGVIDKIRTMIESPATISFYNKVVT